VNEKAWVLLSGILIFTVPVPTVSSPPPGQADHFKTMNGQDIFGPVATGAVPANIKSRHDHPVQNKHVS
jgi:endo-1,3(4)-beta-glucanase